MKDLTFLKNMILAKFEDGIKAVFEELKNDSLFFEYNNDKKEDFFNNETKEKLINILKGSL